jgi:hypothetical protein
MNDSTAQSERSTALMCLRCLWCRARQNGEASGDEASEDSEMYMIRRRREQRKLEQTRQRDEFLENAVMKKVRASRIV